MNDRTATRIANAVRKIEGQVVPVRTSKYPPGANFPFKAWLWCDVSSGSRVWYWGVCRAYPNANLTASPLHLAGRVWAEYQIPIEVSYQDWTVIPDSGYIILSLSLSVSYAALSFVEEYIIEANGLGSDEVPIARIVIDGDSAKLDQIQFGDVFINAGNSPTPAKLTSKVDDYQYWGDVYGDGTDETATVISALIRVNGIAAGETLPFDIWLSAAKQSYGGALVWTLTEVPRLI